jgi:hypothetical protein
MQDGLGWPSAQAQLSLRKWQLSFFTFAPKTRNFRRNFREKVRLEVDSS